MRMSERVRKLRAFIYDNLCKGRIMKSPGPNMDISEIHRQEPQVFFGYVPSREDTSAYADGMPLTAVPSIVIMPKTSYGRHVEDKRFDQYNHIHRPQEMGQELACKMLFSVYEDGLRLPGFLDKYDATGEMDMSLITEGTDEAVLTLLDWMNDGLALLMGTKVIPGTDLWVQSDTITYDMYADQKFITDKRPIYYGLLDVTFGSYAQERLNPEIEQLL